MHKKPEEESLKGFFMHKKTFRWFSTALIRYCVFDGAQVVVALGELSRKAASNAGARRPETYLL